MFMLTIVQRMLDCLIVDENKVVWISGYFLFIFVINLCVCDSAFQILSLRFLQKIISIVAKNNLNFCMQNAKFCNVF